jgi:exosortase O
VLRSELGAAEQGETRIPFKSIKGWILPGLVACFWLLVHWGSLAAWLGDLGSRLSLILWVLAGLALLAVLVGSKPKGINIAPHLAWGPWVLLVAAGLLPFGTGSLLPSIGFVSQSWQLSWGLYGLIGLFVPGSLWRRGLPFAWVVSVLLPFGTAFGNGLGFPARLLTAQIVEQLLRGMGVAAISSHDIILLENGIAHVDLPCSGLKGLWVGSCFLLGATGLEGRRIGWRWLGVATFTLSALILANVLRVWVLVEIGYGLKQPLLAELLHVPLGVLGFGGACGLSWLALQWVPAGSLLEPSGFSFLPQRSPPWLVWLLLPLLWLGSVWLPQSERIPQVLDWQRWQGSPDWAMTPLPLTAAEQDFFRLEAGTSVLKTHFDTGKLQGSLLLVGSSTWRQQHAPELCWAANGLHVDQMIPVQLNQDLKARWLTLENGSQSGFYWFQSAQNSTDNLLDRIVSDLQRQDTRWVLVSAILEGSYSPNQVDIQVLTQEIQTRLISVFEN